MLSSVLCLISFVVWIIAFVGITAISPLFLWTNMTDYIDFVNSYNQFFQYLAKSFMIIFSLSFMILAFVFNEIVEVERKLLSKLALAFAIMFATLSCLHYWVQVTSVRWALEEEVYAGLQHFLQSYPRSFSSSVNMFAWTVLLGLSNLLFYIAFKPERNFKSVKIALLIIAFSCLIATIGFLLQIDFITFLCINIGLGLGFFWLTISSIRYFIKIKV